MEYHKKVTNGNNKVNNVSLNKNNKIINEPKSVSEEFNTYFSTVADTLINSSYLTSNSISPHIKNTVNNSIFVQNITEKEILDILSNLKLSYCSGIDEIPDAIIKKCVHFLPKPTHKPSQDN